MVDIGTWIKPLNGNIKSIKYLQLTEKNIENYTTLNGVYSLKKDFIFVERCEIKQAKNYLEKLLNLKIGDLICGNRGITPPWKDRISKLPKINTPFDIHDYIYEIIKTEKGNWIWYLDAPSSLL